jgi:hypothetical protein
MLRFVWGRRSALFVSVSLACIAIGSTPSRAAHQAYLAVKGQKQGSIKSSGHNPNGTANLNTNVHVSVHPVTPHIPIHPIITHVQIK